MTSLISTQNFMEQPNSVKCGNCIFKGFNGEDKMVCRRYPPLTLAPVTSGSQKWSFPLIVENLFCGEFLPKDNLTAIEWVAWRKGLQEDGQVQK